MSGEETHHTGAGSIGAGDGTPGGAGGGGNAGADVKRQGRSEGGCPLTLINELCAMPPKIYFEFLKKDLHIIIKSGTIVLEVIKW